MHWTLALIACLVLWALAGGIWRKGSAALAAAWGVGQFIFIVTGDELPIKAYICVDLVVIDIIFWYYGSKLDAAILVLFAPAWWAYFNLIGRDQWWTLWGISCLQLFLAGPWPQLQRIIFSVSHGPRRAET